ncbi:MAG: type II secretion system F family protein [Acidobacteria bacterium]|nr:type II secretion system F family protein [Acidobacteriota bacterium]
MEILLPALVFLVVVGVAVALFAAFGGNKQENVVGTRLEAIERGQRRGNIALQLQLVRDEMLSDVPALHRMLARWSWVSRLRTFIAQAGMDMKPGKFTLLSATAGLAAFIIAQYTFPNPVLTTLASVGAAFLPLAVIAFKRSQRLRAFEKNFPEAIDLLGRAIRAGHSFATGLEMIATELPNPVAAEFRMVFDEQNFGLPLRDALLNLSERVPIVDVNFFVTAVLIQKESGGNLAEILDKLSHVIRERFMILGEVRVRTTQGRLTATILIALPPIMAMVLRGMNPGYMDPLFTDPWGPYILGTAALMQVVGAAMLWKIVHIKV